MGPPIITGDSIESPTINNQSSFIWTWQASLLAIPLGLIVIGTILGNFLVLYAAVTRSQNLRLPTHFIIANLALADFLVGVLVMPFLAVLQVTGRWYFGPVYCEAWTVIHFWLCASSILSTCAVCIERYIGVRYPMSHRTIMNANRIWGLVSCVWILAGLLAFGSLYIWPQPPPSDPHGLVCPINQQIGHVIAAVVGILYVPAVIMIILYLKIYLIATKHMNLMKKGAVRVAATPSSSSDSQQKGLLTSFFNKKNPGLGQPDPKQTTALEPESSSTTEVSISFGTSSPRGSTEDLDGSKKGNTSSASGAASVPSNTSRSDNVALLKNVQRRKEINLAKRLSFLVGILLATYLPFFTLYMVMAFKPGSINLEVFSFFGWIRYFNSCINPLIYAFAVPAYRKEMTGIVYRCLRRFQR